MKFSTDRIYLDRIKNRYKYIERRGGVLLFSINNKLTARHVSGNYRWDNNNTPLNIIEEE